MVTPLKPYTQVQEAGQVTIHSVYPCARNPRAVDPSFSSERGAGCLSADAGNAYSQPAARTEAGSLRVVRAACARCCRLAATPPHQRAYFTCVEIHKLSGPACARLDALSPRARAAQEPRSAVAPPLRKCSGADQRPAATSTAFTCVPPRPLHHHLLPPQTCAAAGRPGAAEKRRAARRRRRRALRSSVPCAASRLRCAPGAPPLLRRQGQLRHQRPHPLATYRHAATHRHRRRLTKAAARNAAPPGAPLTSRAPQRTAPARCHVPPACSREMRQALRGGTTTQQQPPAPPPVRRQSRRRTDARRLPPSTHRRPRAARARSP